MNKALLCTLGPASMDRHTIHRLDELGVTLFRINLSHTPADRVAATIEEIKRHTDVPICLDTEGAQIRTGPMADGGVDLVESDEVSISRQAVTGDATQFNLYPANAIDLLEIGDFIRIDFDSVLVQIIDIGPDHASLRVLNGGRIGSNKAVTVERDIPLPALTEKDIIALGIGREMGIRHVALSFANRAEDVAQIRAIAGKDAFVISKIECLNGLANLEAIADRSNALLIDRGDLSRQIAIERIPEVQKRIIASGRAHDVSVYVATNLLESMVFSSTPTRAEVNDVYNTLSDGADGLVLAAETAIGRYPIQCANMIVRMVRQFESGTESIEGPGLGEPVSLLLEPHGGALVHGEVTNAERRSLGRLPRLEVQYTDLLDCQQIANGTYSPLDGFMNCATLETVLNENRLPDGTAWTLPLILQVDKSLVHGFGAGDRIALTDNDDDVYATLDIDEIGELDLDRILTPWFGTASPDHPGVARILAGGTTMLAGRIKLVKRISHPLRQYELTPRQTRFLFHHKGWSRVVGFHTRNPAHRVHEHIQLKALEQSSADGLFVSPVIGPKKPGDFLPDPIMRSYQALVNANVYPQGKVVLGCFATYSRYCGPREAVFTALCRKNMGCSHFIIGRDHTGVGNFYAPDANQRLFDDLGDLGIKPIFFEPIGYCADEHKYLPEHEAGNIVSISGTEARRRLQEGEALPDWYIRPEIQALLRDSLVSGKAVFHQSDVLGGVP